MKLKDIFRKSVIAVMAVAAVSAAMVSCDDDDSVYNYDSRLHSFGPSPATRGETVRFMGNGLKGVRKIIFPVGVEVSDFVSKTDDEIVCLVPQEAVPGRIRLVMANGEIITKSIITFSEPITVESVTAEKTVLTAGDEITVTGEYLYNVASVTFGNDAEVTTEDFVKQERHTLVVKVPAEAKTGKLTLTDGLDWIYETEDEFQITTASVTALSKTDLQEGEEVDIIGENLQLVKRVIFPGDLEAESFVLAEDNKSIRVAVPIGTCSGAIELELFSLDRISTPEFTVPTIEVTSVTPSRNIGPGQKLTAKGKLLDLVSAIEFPGGEVMRSGWTVNAAATELTFTVPASMVDGMIAFIQNDNIRVMSEGITVAKNGNEFWKGNVDLGNWNANLEVGADKDPLVYAAFSEAITAPGKLTIHFTQDASKTWWQIQPRYRRDWSVAFASVRDNGNSGIVETAAGATSMTLNITQEDIDELNGGGWAFSGCNLTITSMEYEDPNAPKIFLSVNYDISPDGDWENLEVSAQSDEDNSRIWYQMFCGTINGPGTLVINLDTYDPADIPADEEIQMEFRYLYNGWKEHFANAPQVLTIEPGAKNVTIKITQKDVDALHGQNGYDTFTNKKGETRVCDPWEIGWAFSGKYFVIKNFAFKAD